MQREARRLMEEALAPASALPDSHRAQALLVIGSMAWSEGDAASAVAALKDGLALARKVGDARAEAIGHMMLGLGLLAAGAGATEQAVTHFEMSRHLFGESGERWWEAFALNYLGLVPLLAGDLDRAAACLQASLAVARAAEDRVPLHQARYSLGLVAQATGDHAQATVHFGEGLRLATELGDIVNAGYFVKGIALAAGALGRPAAAIRLLAAATAALEATGSPPYRYLNNQEVEQGLLDAARIELGKPAASAGWELGRSLPLDVASRDALAVAQRLDSTP
jgi:tetratricopeptide (TPR) repeat protein